jgi:hypothetical protein
MDLGVSVMKGSLLFILFLPLLLFLAGCEGTEVLPCSDSSSGSSGSSTGNSSGSSSSLNNSLSNSSGDGYSNTAEAFADSRVATDLTISVNKAFFESPAEITGNMTDQADLSLAKGEHEVLQLVLFPYADIEDVRVTVSELMKSSCTIIPASVVEINIVAYVHLTDSKVNGSQAGRIPVASA